MGTQQNFILKISLQYFFFSFKDFYMQWFSLQGSRVYIRITGRDFGPNAIKLESLDWGHDTDTEFKMLPKWF